MTTAEPISLPVRRRPAAASAPLQRAHGEARLTVRADGEATRIVENFQSGSARLRFPRVRGNAPLEAVLVNTAGGVTGGDRLAYSVSAAPAARAVITTQAAERIYRRSTGTATIATTLLVDDGATLEWLPQETIIFDGAALARSLKADVASTGQLLAVEAIVLGRSAMGETVREARIADSWRIHRDGKLVFAEGLRLDGDSTAIMSGAATGGGATALATIVLVAADATDRIDAARAALQDGAGESGVSAWNGILVARLIAAGGEALRADLVRLLETLRGAPLPRLWSC